MPEWRHFLPIYVSTSCLKELLCCTIHSEEDIKPSCDKLLYLEYKTKVNSFQPLHDLLFLKTSDKIFKLNISGSLLVQWGYT